MLPLAVVLGRWYPPHLLLTAAAFHARFRPSCSSRLLQCLRNSSYPPSAEVQSPKCRLQRPSCSRFHVRFHACHPDASFVVEWRVFPKRANCVVWQGWRGGWWNGAVWHALHPSPQAASRLVSRLPDLLPRQAAHGCLLESVCLFVCALRLIVFELGRGSAHVWWCSRGRCGCVCAVWVDFAKFAEAASPPRRLVSHPLTTEYG